MSILRYNSNPNEQSLLATLKELLKGVENENVEFKEAKSDFSLDKLGKYVSALSNEANLQGIQYSWLIFGIKDDTHEVVGTNYRNNLKSLEKLKLEIAQGTTGGLTFMDIFSVYPNNDQNKRVLMFQIPAAAIGIPTGWKNKYYGRNGESIGELSLEKIDRIRGQHRKDWSKRIIENATIQDLDPAAIAVARNNYCQKLQNSSNPAAAAEYSKLSDFDFLSKLRLIRDGKVTNAAMVLLGKGEYEDLFDFPPMIMWRLHGSDDQIKDSQIFTVPFILAIDEAYKKIRNLTYRYMPSQLSLFPTETQQYDPWTLRELINNCIAHQDYESGMRIYLDEFEDRLIISNAGSFLPGNIEPVLDPAYAPPYYRNPLLDNSMVKFRMIETASSGIRRIYAIQQKKLFPLPDYDLSTYNVVKVTLYGKILDDKYAQVLFKNPDMDLETAFLLDKVQKHKEISKEAADKLRKKKLIEGRRPNLYISATIAKTLDQKAEYIKTKGFSDQYYRDMIIQYLKNFGTGKKSDFYELLQDKLSNSLTPMQKDNKVKNLLQSLKRKGKIKLLDNKEGHNREWTLNK